MNKYYPFLVALFYCLPLNAEPIKEVNLMISRPAEKGCKWVLFESPTNSSLQVQECDYGFRRVTHFFKEDKIFQRLVDIENKEEKDVTEYPVIEFFVKDPSEDPAAALKRTFIDKLEEFERTHCIAQKLNTEELYDRSFKDPAKSAWAIVPDQEYSAKIAKETPEGDIPETVCGDYGFPHDYQAHFEFHANSPYKFAWVNIGQDDPLFDEQSLEF